MSTQLHIHQFNTRYRLSSKTRDSHSRLDRVLREVMDHALEEAIDELGIAGNEELCIRELFSLVHIPLQQSDSQMVMQLSRALALAIQDSVTRADSQQVVRFASRLHALVDFTSGVAYNRLQRAWAWRQLGFIDDKTTLTLQTATQQLVDTLQAEPELMMPLFTNIARDDRLLALFKRLQTEQWLRLSQALAGTLISHAVPLPTQLVDRQKPTQNQFQMAESQLQKSRIAQTLLTSPQSFLQADVPLAALMVLIAAELDCAVFSRPQNWLTEWLALLGRTVVNAQPALTVLAGDWLPELPSKSELNQPQENHGLADDPVVSQDQPQLNKSATAGQHTNGTDEIEHGVSDEINIATHDELLSKVPEWNQPELINTQWGGMFLLYGLMDQLALPQQMMNDNVLTERSFGWLLYHFARMLLSQQDDASCLLFAGAIPGEPLLWEDENEPGEQEQEALHYHLKSLTDCLFERLEWQGESSEMLEWLCYRPAGLRIESGWLSVTFSLDAVDTRIRRAMLDLNPDYLPWLGRVVEIVYE